MSPDPRRPAIRRPANFPEVSARSQGTGAKTTGAKTTGARTTGAVGRLRNSGLDSNRTGQPSPGSRGSHASGTRVPASVLPSSLPGLLPGLVPGLVPDRAGEKAQRTRFGSRRSAVVGRCGTAPPERRGRGKPAILAIAANRCGSRCRPSRSGGSPGEGSSRHPTRQPESPGRPVDSAYLSASLGGVEHLTAAPPGDPARGSPRRRPAPPGRKRRRPFPTPSRPLADPLPRRPPRRTLSGGALAVPGSAG